MNMINGIADRMAMSRTEVSMVVMVHKSSARGIMVDRMRCLLGLR